MPNPRRRAKDFRFWLLDSLKTTAQYILMSRWGGPAPRWQPPRRVQRTNREDYRNQLELVLE